MTKPGHLRRREFLTLTGGAGLALTAIGAERALAQTHPRGPMSDTQMYLQGTAGYRVHDLVPGSTSLINWGSTESIILDSDYTSVGVDLGSIQNFNSIELFSLNETTRLERTDLSIYVSDDNVEYSKVDDDWDFIKHASQINIFNLDCNARFVKVHNHFDDALRVDVAQLTGWVDEDIEPETGNLARLGVSGGFALDYQKRSVGVDLRQPMTIVDLTLHDEDESTRLVPSDLSVWVSQENDDDWVLVEGIQVAQEPASFVISGINELARYVKIVQPYTDSNFTFGYELSEMVEVNTAEQQPDPDKFAFKNPVSELIAVSNCPSDRWTLSGGSDWMWRTPLTIHNSNSQPVYDRCFYIDKASLDVPSLVSQGKLQPDLRDARWADDSLRELQFYEDSSGFYVRIPEIAPNESGDIYFYYGNPDAVYRGKGHEALQVEYGNRTLQRQPQEGFTNEKPARLPDGTLLIASSTTSQSDGIYARYSFDGGQTWSDPEQLLPAIDPGEATDVPGGFYVDPVTGTVTMIFFAYYRYSALGGCLNPEVCRSDLYVVQTDLYEQGKPQFALAAVQAIDGIDTASGHPINYALSYCNPIRLSNNNIVAPFHYVFRDDGGFASSVLISSDNGASWTKSPSELSVEAGGHEVGLTEPGIIELSDGTLKMYLRDQRHDSFYLATASSSDNGETWTSPSESIILATNTMPSLRRSPAEPGILMTWSGHNATGGMSKLRNDLTLAYSADESQSWVGYRDVVGRTRLSLPNWNTQDTDARLIQCDFVPAGADSWCFTMAGGTHSSLLLEGLSGFLFRSHGVCDDFEYELPEDTVEIGTNLVNDYWWRATPSGSVGTSSDRAFQGVRSLWLSDGQSGTELTAASRRHAKVERAQYRFAVNAANLGSGVYISLQEGYSTHWSSRGAAFILRITSQGDVEYSDSELYVEKRLSGWVDNDVDPALGNLSNINRLGSFAFDYRKRSVGVDLRRPMTVNEIRLHDEDESTRLVPSDLSVWVSQENNSDWVLVEGIQVTQEPDRFVIGGISELARYVKIVQPYTDSDYTFTYQVADMIEVLTIEPEPEVPFQELPVPFTFGTGAWHVFTLDVDLPEGEMGVTIDDVPHGTVSQAHPAEGLGHFLISSGEGGTGTTIYLDELIIQDRSVVMPTVEAVGNPEPVASLKGGRWPRRPG